MAAPFFVLFAVVCHRSIILGGESLPHRLGLFWSPRETKFLGWTVAIIIVTFILSVLVTLLALVSPFGPTITALSVAVFMSYIYVRIAMVLPATAVADGAGEDRWRLTTGTSFDQAWFLTSGNGFRILFVIVLATAPVVIVGILLIYIFASSFLAIILVLIVRHAIPLVAICALSVSYRELIEAENTEVPE